MIIVIYFKHRTLIWVLSPIILSLILIRFQTDHQTSTKEVLLNFGSDQVDFITNMGAFLSFYRKTTIAFAISACLPWISFLFVKWDIFTYQQTVLLRRWWILVIFLIATIMSPPDVFSQIVIALPLWLFLEITWFILALMESKKNYNKKE